MCGTWIHIYALKGDNGGYNYQDKANDEYRKPRNDVQTCQSGNADYCSYATLHPVETALFVGTTLGGGTSVETFVLGGGAIGTYDALLWRIGKILSNLTAWELNRIGSRSNAFGDLSQAAEYGIKPYNQLRKMLYGTDLHAHHLIEIRLAPRLGQSASQTREWLSIALTPAEHQGFTNSWRSMIG